MPVMPEAPYSCRFCNQDLSGYTAEEVAAHEGIPFYGGDYHKVILRWGHAGSFIILADTKEVVTKHKNDGEEIHEKLYRMFLTPQIDYMPKEEGKIGCSVIQESVKSGEFFGISDTEVEEFSAKLKDIRNCTYLRELLSAGEFRTIPD